MSADPAIVVASYSVEASTAQNIELPDIAGLSIKEIAELVDHNAPGISLCRDCAHQISDPELAELTAMTVNGVYYELVDGVWQTEGKS